MHPAPLDGYLRRLGVSSTPDADIGFLRQLHGAHLKEIPFENLSIHLGEPIRLEPDALLDKIVARHRGGFCYELNGAFGYLLATLGYDVTLLAARVWGGEAFSLPFDHLALLVACPDPWLVDVGFGAHSLYPLRMDELTDQPDPGGTFRLVPADRGDIDVVKDGVVQYRIDPRPRNLADFEGMCWWHQTSPASHFTQTLTCSRQTDDGRVTLSGNRLIRTVNGHRDEVELADGATLQAYQELFGIKLDSVPTVRFP